MSPSISRPGLLRRSVAARLWAGLILLALGLSALLGAAAWHSRQAQQAADARLEALAAKAETAQRWLTLTRSNVLRIEAVAASSDPVIEALYKDEIPAVTAAVNALQRELDALELGESDRRLMAAVARQRQDMLSALARLRELKARQESAAARDWLMQRFRPAVAAYVAALEDFVNQQGLERREAQQQLAAARERAWWRLGAALAALLALLGLAAAALVRSIQQPWPRPWLARSALRRASWTRVRRRRLPCRARTSSVPCSRPWTPWPSACARPWAACATVPTR